MSTRVKPINRVYQIGIKNMMFTLLAQGISLVLGIVTGFILPKIMGVTEFGYWQVYLFYLGFVTLFCFGFNDGLYLRYGNLDYRQLPFEKLRSAMRVFIVIILAITIVLFLCSFFEKDPNKVFAFCAISLNLLILGINGTLLTVLQFTNRIKLNSILIVANKLVFVFFILLLLFTQWVDFKTIIIVDIFAKIILLAINIYKSKELFIGKTVSMRDGIKEYVADVKVGIYLTFANIVSLLIIGIGRFIVERFMSIDEYSLYSFATTITSFVLLFLSATSVALYPLLKRISEDMLPAYFDYLNRLICIGLFLLLVGYFPIHYLIENYYSSYSGMLNYFNLLFIIVVSQGKMQFLINTYYKVLREEKSMLIANLFGVVLALVAIIPAFYFSHSMYPIVIGTTITLIWRCYASEIYLKRKLGKFDIKNIIVELSMIILFVVCSLLNNQMLGVSVYVLATFGYIFINRVLLRRFLYKIYNSLVER